MAPLELREIDRYPAAIVPFGTVPSRSTRPFAETMLGFHSAASEAQWDTTWNAILSPHFFASDL